MCVPSNLPKPLVLYLKGFILHLCSDSSKTFKSNGICHFCPSFPKASESFPFYNCLYTINAFKKAAPISFIVTE